MADKKADLAGPGIGDYDELAKALPDDYSSLLTPKQTQEAVLAVKNYIEENLCKQLNLMMVTVPLIVVVETARARPSGFTSPMTTRRTRSTPRSSRPPPSGSGWRSSSSA